LPQITIRLHQDLAERILAAGPEGGRSLSALWRQAGRAIQAHGRRIAYAPVLLPDGSQCAISVHVGHDIDIVAELILPPTMAPAAVLDLLFAAIDGSPGSQYHGMVERQTRCVTVNYADGMHIDITPTLLLNEMDPRQSCLFHAKKEEPTSEHRRLRMNSFGFCGWVNANSPIDVNFEEAYGRRAMAFDARRTRADADVVAVPAHSTVEGGKSVKIVAQQLLKRNRNLRKPPRGTAAIRFLSRSPVIELRCPMAFRLVRAYGLNCPT